MRHHAAQRPNELSILIFRSNIETVEFTSLNLKGTYCKENLFRNNFWAFLLKKFRAMNISNAQ